jgi:hypothetical protein
MQRFPDLRMMGEALLRLAAQQTRIAWAATFDPVVRQRAFGRKTIDTPAHSAALQQPSGARLPWGLIGAAILGWSAAASIATWALVRTPTAVRSPLPTPVEAPPAVPSPAPNAAPAAAPTSPAPAAEPVALPGASNVEAPGENGGAGTVVTQTRELRPEPLPSAPIAEGREGKSPPAAAAAGKPKARPGTSKPRVGQRPSWATAVDAGAPRPAHPHEPEERGTNNAPILD